MSVVIAGTGCYIPEKIITNADLEKMVDTTDEWIVSRTGIRERRIAPENMPLSDMALRAARNALENAKLAPEDLDLIIVASVTGDRRCPSTACILQKKLGAGKCMAFDILAACSGLLYAMETAVALMKHDPKKKNTLIVGAEKLSTIIDWTDRSTCVIFGDGASAIVLKNDEYGSNGCIEAFTVGADGGESDTIYIPAGGSECPSTPETIAAKMQFLRMKGQETFKYAVNAMYEASKETLRKANIAPEQLTWVIPHQANRRIIDAVAHKLGIPLEKLYVNVDKYGNTSSASIGICLDELNRSGKLKRGDMVLLSSFGAGFTWASVMIRW